jgi:hypothetical protein
MCRDVTGATQVNTGTGVVVVFSSMHLSPGSRERKVRLMSYRMSSSSDAPFSEWPMKLGD